MMDRRLARLVPQPASVRERPGQLMFAAPPAVVPAGTGPEPAAAAGAVRHLLAGLPWPGGDGRASECTVAIDASIGAEAYRLTIDATGIGIVAGGTAGAIYAVQTLRQLLPADAWRAAPTTGGDLVAAVRRDR